MDAAIQHFALVMEPETKTIARGLRRRDPDLLDGLIARYEFRLYRYLLYLTGNADQARDLFQDTWLRVLARGRQYNGKSRFEPWLFSIARHLVIDSARRKHPESLDTLLDPSEVGTCSEPRARDDSSPLAAFAEREQAARIGAVLDHLPAVFREVLLLRFQEELSLEEIAGVTRAPLSTVKSRLYRGLTLARELMEEGQP
jgi:RNA polymerase sigma-70 factor, ECF subfamily